MALSFLYRLVRRVVELLWILRMDDAAKDAEILVLATNSPCSNVRSSEGSRNPLTGFDQLERPP